MLYSNINLRKFWYSFCFQNRKKRDRALQSVVTPLFILKISCYIFRTVSIYVKISKNNYCYLVSVTNNINCEHTYILYRIFLFSKSCCNRIAKRYELDGMIVKVYPTLVRSGQVRSG